MRLQTSNDSVSGVDRGVGIALAAFSMFVVGYTATRAFLSQPQASDSANTKGDLVIPHQATLWSDFAN